RGPERIDVQAKVSADELSFGQTDSVSGLDGYCEGRFIFDFETGKQQARARYDIIHFAYRNRLVTELSGNLVLDPNSMQLVSEEFTASLCDGDVTGTLKMDLQPDKSPRYQLELKYDSVDTEKFLTARAITDPQQFSQGLATGRLALEGNIDNFSDCRGILKTTIVDMKMGEQSLLGKILTAVQLKQPENFIFSEVDLDAAILGPELVFDRIRMLGNPLIFYGTGKVNLQNRQIEVDLASWDRQNGSEETVLDELARGIGSALWKVQLRGTLDTPEVDAIYLTILKQPLGIFKESN
ncbi:MAG: hypothetical protein ACYSN7_01260, partial [Planctomycetota bacterium]